MLQTIRTRQNSLQFCRQYLTDRVIRTLSCGAGLVSLATLVALFVFLAALSLPLITGGHWAQIISWTWRPYQGHYGILPMIAGSLALSSVAFVLAYPVSLGVCLFVCSRGSILGLRYASA